MNQWCFFRVQMFVFEKIGISIFNTSIIHRSCFALFLQVFAGRDLIFLARKRSAHVPNFLTVFVTFGSQIFQQVLLYSRVRSITAYRKRAKFVYCKL